MLRRSKIPSYQVIEFTLGVRGKAVIAMVEGDDPDGGCRTLLVGDVLGVKGHEPPHLWEVAAIDYRDRVVYLDPFRHEDPNALAYKVPGFFLEIVHRSWESPTFAQRRKHADKLGMVALNR